MKGKHVRPQTGDVFAIPLGDGRYCFGRLLHDCGIAIYDYRSKNFPDMATLATKPIRFHASIFDKAIRSGLWPRIGMLPADDESDNWSPPCFIRDELLEESFEIYERGRIRRATKEEIQGLEEQHMWFPDSFVEELRRRFRRCRVD